jgi:hypothetical protein
LLPSGKVLVAGGTQGDFSSDNLSSSELYDPNTGTWSLTGSLNVARFGLTATLLPDGKVLVAGGESQDGAINNSAELYNPTTGTWSYTGSLSTGRYGHTATLLPNGEVLVAGGHDWHSNTYLDSADVYDPATGNWSGTAKLNVTRMRHTAVLLQSGKVLVAGGNNRANRLLSAELYDSGSSSTINPIDDPQFFVRQHYLDFLNREPDDAGLAFWANEITSCGGDTQCSEVKRINVSAAFFLSIEFQETGFYAVRVQRAAFGHKSADASRMTFASLMADARALGDGVVVGQGDWQGRLEANKQAYAERVVASADFAARYPSTQTAAEYVAALYASAGVMPAPTETDEAVASFYVEGASGRAAALTRVAESASLRSAEFNPAFVLMEYFGYLRRDPDEAGYNFWLAKLEQFGGNYIQAEMVKAFILSIEYRRRFGQS